MPKEFVEVAGQLVRLASVTRLAEEPVLYDPNASGYFIHIADGGMISCSEFDYKKVKRALMPAKRTSKESTRV